MRAPPGGAGRAPALILAPVPVGVCVRVWAWTPGIAPELMGDRWGNVGGVCTSWAMIPAEGPNPDVTWGGRGDWA